MPLCSQSERVSRCLRVVVDSDQQFGELQGPLCTGSSLPRLLESYGEVVVSVGGHLLLCVCSSLGTHGPTMDSDDDNSSGGASSLSRSSVELSPHPEEENIAPHGNISNANSGKSRITATLDAVSNVGKVNGVAVPTTPRKNQAAAGSPSRKRRLGSPTASISFDGAHATPPSAIGGGLMPSPEKKKQKKLEIPSSSQTTGPSGSQKLKGKKKEGQGEGWEEVLERLGATACKLLVLTCHHSHTDKPVLMCSR